MKRWLPLALVALAFLAHHLALAFTVNLNGDELGLLERALRTLRTGEVVGGGRPGLGSLAVIPFARDCLDAVSAIVRARLAWTLFVVAGAAGLVVLLRQMIPADRRRLPAIVTALALWILAPAFLHYSVQLRTDQPAIAFGLWCGVALLASQRRSWLALVAGVLFGVGFLFSQKTAYVGALVGVLVLGRLASEQDLRPGREFLRAALLVAGAAGTALLYRLLTSSVGGEAPALLSLSGNMGSREYYADMFGFRHFRWMLPTLLAQVIALGVVAIVSLDWAKKRGTDGARIATAWGVVLVGAAIFLFHTTRAPYFYMVMGLFPAVAGGLVIGPMLDRLETERERWILLGALWIPLVLTAIPGGIRLLEDTQRPQREALAFVERNLPSEARGFQAYSLFMCRDDPEPFPFLNYRVADVRFGGPDAEGQAQGMIEEFRSRPVSFMVMPTTTLPIPFDLWTFWWAHYVHYGHHVYVPGAGLAEGRAATRFFDVLVDGDYRWHPTDGQSPLLVDGERLEAGGAVRLEPGEYRLELPDGGQGLFVLDLPEPPSDTPELPLFQPWPGPAADLEAEG